MIPTAVQPSTQVGYMDCGVVALAQYLGLPYRQVSEAALVIDPRVHLDGLTIPEMRKVAKALTRGPLKLAQALMFERDEATGILVLERGRDQHYALLFE